MMPLPRRQEESYQMPASTKHDSPYTILTSDKLVSPSSNHYRSYTKGGKTGSLDDWQNFAGWHTQDGETYVSVVLHSPKTDEDPRPALTETAELMDWAFATFTVTAALDTTQPITELPIVYSSQTDTVMIYPADDMQTLLPRQGGAELTEKTSMFRRAPLRAHQAGRCGGYRYRYHAGRNRWHGGPFGRQQRTATSCCIPWRR